jgi:hypothetical protein
MMIARGDEEWYKELLFLNASLHLYRDKANLSVESNIAPVGK